MPSIFIWKSNTSLPSSSKIIRYYAGEDWFLEEVPHERERTRSFQYTDCIECTDFTVYHVKKKSADWVGAYLLESIEIPYSVTKEDSYGLCDQIGVWMRFITPDNVSLKKEELAQRFQDIQAWLAK
jgi:hypothetical protein